MCRLILFRESAVLHNRAHHLRFFNAFGFVGGYFGAKLFQSEENDAQTIAIEVGMQNSGLAVSLAQQFFSGLPLATLPGAIFSFWHNVAGVGFVYIKSNLFRIRLPKSH